MDKNDFVFLDDKYFKDFPDKNLMRNKEMVSGASHDRPCFYVFKGEREIFWLIPISSQVDKFKTMYQKKVKKYGKCDTLVFGDVLGRETAFLIQNMCPVTQNYILGTYVLNNSLVHITSDLQKEIEMKAKKVLTLERQGKKLIFPDVLAIEKALEIKENQKQERIELAAKHGFSAEAVDALDKRRADGRVSVPSENTKKKDKPKDGGKGK